MAKTVDPAVAASVMEIVHSIEQRSSVELVVEVRARSGAYADADGRAAALMAFATLAVVLFSPWMFSHWLVAILVVSGYALGLLLPRALTPLRRLLTRGRERELNVRSAAAAAFTDRGVSRTRAGTGVLLFLSLFERRVEIIADRGVLDAVPVLEWNQFKESASKRFALSRLPQILRELEPLMTRYLPAAADDINELPNEIRSWRE